MDIMLAAAVERSEVPLTSKMKEKVSEISSLPGS